MDVLCSAVGSLGAGGGRRGGSRQAAGGRTMRTMLHDNPVMTVEVLTMMRRHDEWRRSRR